MPSPHLRQFSTEQLASDFDHLHEIHEPIHSRGLQLTSARILSHVCNRIEQELHRLRLRRTDPNLLTRLRKALKDIGENADIVVTKADKGDAIVLMDASHYTDLAWSHLREDNTYQLLSANPTSSIVKNFNKYLRCCREDRVIDPGLQNRLRLPDDTTAQTIYYLSKVHVSAQTPTHLLLFRWTHGYCIELPQ